MTSSVSQKLGQANYFIVHTNHSIHDNIPKGLAQHGIFLRCWNAFAFAQFVAICLTMRTQANII